MAIINAHKTKSLGKNGHSDIWMNTANCWKSQIIQKKIDSLEMSPWADPTTIKIMFFPQFRWWIKPLGISNGGYIVPPIVLMVIGILGFLNHLKMVRNHRTHEFNLQIFSGIFCQFLHHHVSVYLSEVKRKGYDITVVLIFSIVYTKNWGNHTLLSCTSSSNDVLFHPLL